MCRRLRGYRILSEETMVRGTPWERHGVDCDSVHAGMRHADANGKGQSAGYLAFGFQS
jgi:hypothetical protein